MLRALIILSSAPPEQDWVKASRATDQLSRFYQYFQLEPVVDRFLDAEK